MLAYGKDWHVMFLAHSDCRQIFKLAAYMFVYARKGLGRVPPNCKERFPLGSWERAEVGNTALKKKIDIYIYIYMT